MKFSFLLLILILLGTIYCEEDDVEAWYKEYPDPHFPVSTDECRFIHTWVKTHKSSIHFSGR